MKFLFSRLTILAALTLVALVLPSVANADDAPTDPLIETEWYLSANNTVPTMEGTSITLSFDENGQMGGSSGCNFYEGNYTIDGNTLQFGSIARSLMGCLADVLQQETRYFAALSQVTGYRRIGPDRLVLELSDGSALVFVAVPEIAGSSWLLIDDGFPPEDRLITADSGVTLTFDQDSGVSGNSGCNHYRTTYILMIGSLTFDPILSTSRACLNEDANALETHLFAALEATTSYTITPDNLTLYYGEDGQQLVFGRILNLVGTTWQLASFGLGAAPTPVADDKLIKVSFGAGEIVSVSGVCQSDTGESFVLESLGEIAVQELPSLLPFCLNGNPTLDILPITGYTINDDGQLVIRYADGQVLVFEFVE
jgi:heat shock protein HslJ